MYIQVNDGIIDFAIYLIKVELSKEQWELLLEFQIETEGIVCYSEEEKSEIENILSDNKITFFTENIQVDPGHIIKSKDIKYASRSEAIIHLLEDIEPESEVIPNLKREKAKLQEELTLAKIDINNHKEKLKQTEDALLTVIFNKKEVI